MPTLSDRLRERIRTVPDWPKPGIQFRDITPVLQDPAIFRQTIQVLTERHRDTRADVVAGIDARGFIVGAVLAHALNIGFVPIRKQGKLPYTTVTQTYDLEYGSAAVELHTDALCVGNRVLLVDDLIATGGTMLAAKQLIERLNATTIEGIALIDLPDLGGSARLRAAGLPVFSLVDFEGH